MVKVEKHGIILSPTNRDFENKGTVNPGVYQEGDEVHLFYRAVQDQNLFSIGYAKANGPLKIIERLDRPIITRDFDFESQGVKDATIVKIDGTYYNTYSAYDGINITGALATSKDLIHFEKKGIITPKINYLEYERLVHSSKKLNPKYHQFYNLYAEMGVEEDDFRFLRDKDVVLFPKKINGKFAMLHCIWPGIQIVYFDDFSDLTPAFWEDYLENIFDYIVLDPKGIHEVNYIGVGGPPIETDEGWILIYYGVQETTRGRKYHVNAALLQIGKPEIEISRLDTPLFSPTKDWEKKGQEEDVVFPSGHALFDNEMFIYYGAGCTHTAVAKLDLEELLLELRKKAHKI